MRRISYFPPAVLILILNLQIASLHAQWRQDERLTPSHNGQLMGGLGFAFIDDETYILFNLRTELIFGNVGLGLDIPLRFNTSDGKLRKADWNGTYDYFRLLRYIRYGRKRQDPFYARLGTLDAARLGHGFIVNYYSNEANFDSRKIGLEFDLRLHYWGTESLISNFDDLEIAGGRTHVRPLLDIKGIGLLNRTIFGATLVSDYNPDDLHDDIMIGGVDIEFPLLTAGPFFSHLYADYAKIKNFGSGKAVGIELGLRQFAGILTVFTKLERRFLGKHFLPSYFGPFYEIERFQPTESAPLRKSDQLLGRTSSAKGIYGELFAHFLNFVRVLGTFERIDGEADSGRLHVAALLSKSIARISARGVYDKTGLRDINDLFSLDDRSIARLGVGYQINPYLYLFMDYTWTFQFDQTTQTFKSQKRIEPQISFVLPLNFTAQ